MTTAFAVALLAFLASSGPSGAPRGQEPLPNVPSNHQPKPSERRVEITFLANEGFLLHSGRFTVLIDGFLKDPYKEYEALPHDVFKRLASGEPPFDGYVLSLVSHNHPDHFQPLVAERFLRANPDSALMSSPQVVDSLIESAQEFRKIQKQVRSIPLKRGQSRTIAHDEMSIEMILLPHGGERNRGIVQNYGHLISMGGFMILHVGDADMDPEIFAQFSQREIDIAFVPYWFFTSEEGVKIVDELIRPKYTIACHVPLADKELFIERMKTENPHVAVFGSSLESKIFDAESSTRASGDETPPAEEKDSD